VRSASQAAARLFCHHTSTSHAKVTETKGEVFPRLPVVPFEYCPFSAFNTTRSGKLIVARLHKYNPLLSSSPWPPVTDQGGISNLSTVVVSFVLS
jgi:hypothetical protein